MTSKAEHAERVAADRRRRHEERRARQAQPSRLADWLENCITEDEAAATAAINEAACSECSDGRSSLHEAPTGQWQVSPDHHPVIEDNGNVVAYNERSPAVNAHIARNDPARALREAELKRGLLQLADGVDALEQSLIDEVRCSDPALTLGPAIRKAVAEVYQDRAGYAEAIR